MFKGCTSLTQAPELPALSAGSQCYQSMFSGCTALTTPPELPATTLAGNCYNEMFYNCVSLTKAPELPAETIVNSCYIRMFRGCGSLSEIKLGYTGNFTGDSTAEWAFNNWVADVSADGTFYYDGEDTTTGDSAIPTGWTVKSLSVPDGLRFTARDGGETVQLYKNGDAPSCSFEYSTDGEQTWSDLTLGTTFTLANAGDTISFRAKTAQPTLAYNYDRNHMFQLGNVGHVSIDGSFYALLRQDWKTAPKYGWMGQRSLRALFAGVTGEFDITNVQPLDWEPTYDCYGGMFFYTNIAGAVPSGLLPATTLATYCYQAMFEGSNIANAPDLPATVLANYCY